MLTWDELNLNTELKRAIAIQDNPEDLLFLSIPEIAYRTGLSAEQALLLIQRISQLIYPLNSGYFVAFLKKTERLSIGDVEFDKWLLGGIPMKGIVEIAGESATGKTQIALQLCLTVQLPLDLGGFNANPLYICTEDAFPLRRLNQLIPVFKERYQSSQIDANNVYIQHIGDLEMFEIVILFHLENLIQTLNIKLIIIDSIASIFRADDNSKIEHSKLIFKISDKLKRLNEDLSICIICINQVSDYFQEDKYFNESEIWSSKFITENQIINYNYMKFYNQARLDYKLWKLVPSLGLTWSNCVATRIVLTKQDNRRRFYIVWSPDVESKFKEYKIDSNGFVSQ